MKISIIAAVAENGVIGRNGELPWRLSSDLKRFRQLTMGKTVIVGRKTHESILRRLGHPLEGRRTIVVTRDQGYTSECEVTHSLEEALTRTQNNDEVFIIGGAELYREALPRADKLYITHVEAYCEGDVKFSDWDKSAWKATHMESCPASEENEIRSRFEIYERVNANYNFENTRYDDQRAIMQKLTDRGVCNFCPDHQIEGELMEPVWKSEHWRLGTNRWPYKFTILHLLAIPNRHIEFEDELTDEETGERLEMLRWAKKHYGLKAYSTGARSGETALTGASVRHFHFHIIVADPDTTKEDYERVRFPMGPKPAKK
ncbi:MAG: dihydrofolate reductase [Candidatus Sungbacteria bacterium]|uniref:dihydrofolate reductase n=1 Tax=Candidatus Sungiibacteriota bacterium TaxID=2750080 RepID=A0A9D6LP98_9BACT|nr:dihydrofolate reductase [Candidatus Sungbacteria bacterium]